MSGSLKEKKEAVQKKYREATVMLNQINVMLKVTDPKSKRDKNNAEAGHSKKVVRQKIDYLKVLIDVKDMENNKKTLFEFSKYLKNAFKEKTQEVLLIEKSMDHKSIRKNILKYIQVFHPDKQQVGDDQALKASEEITKLLNSHLKFY